jgi:hypothetical protein
MAVYNPLKSRQVVFLADSTKLREFGLGLSPSDLRLTWRVVGREETGAPIDSTVTVAPPPIRPISRLLSARRVGGFSHCRAMTASFMTQ